MTLLSRPYADDDLPHLQAALARWTYAAGDCGYCHIGDLPHRIYANLRGRRPLGELVRVWEDGGELVGLAICFRFEVAFDLFVAPALRGTDGELTMLQAAYETTLSLVRGLGREDTSVITDVFSCDHTRMEQLKRLGFAEYRRWDYITERGLSDPIPEPRMPEGFSIRHAAPGDERQLADARNSAFDAGWTAEQYRDEVMLKPGYHPERELVVVAPGGQIAAFTVIALDALNRVGQFEPVGTRREFQRRGLARAMMLWGLREMRRQGMERALVSHDATNLPALELYRSLGFGKKYETLGYRRQ
jgi:ribosomal protein S18 acetylase RimI-like enzyme